MRINKYLVKDKIYEGSETILYRAVNTDSSQKVILKLAKTEPAFIRLKNEYYILKVLNIQGVPSALDFNQNSDRPYVALTDISGLPLSNSIEKIKKYPTDRICEIFISIAKVLDQIHRKNIIHKDMKPSNILYEEENDTISIIDFGISSQFDFKLREQKNINTLEGTLKYISPEQTGRVNRSVDQRSDLYSLGITFYQLLTGNPPFNSEDPIELIHNHI